ncbi:MAG: hypothetical protein HQK51_15060 [Oligoflexia bacterium]|nr:hypothetical protein [Oligoflexia bacterium]
MMLNIEKSIKNVPTKRLFLLITTIVIFMFAGCMKSDQEKQFEIGPNIPAASGIINYETTENGNTKIKIKVKNLALPNKVRSEASTYVVWVISVKENSLPQNVGVLKVSENLSGEINTLTPHKEFEVFITAEAVGDVNKPSGEHLLKAQIIKQPKN